LIDQPDRRPNREEKSTFRSVPLHSTLPLLLVKTATTSDRRRRTRHHNLIFLWFFSFSSFVQKLKDGVDLI
jgi:hypothetical protein